ncbi:hypothetical protein BDV12DRAFT_208059 [Aspergillus spectabilis]
MKIFFFSNKFPLQDIPCLFRSIRLQRQCPQHILLRRLIDETTSVIRDEIRLLDATTRAQIPPFQSILDLAEDFDWQRSPLAGMFECVFLSLASLCVFLGEYEVRPREFTLSKDTAVLTGLGLGFLAATAIAASPSLLDIPATAAEVIRIAMRTGRVVHQKAQELEIDSPEGSLQSWSTLVKGVGEEAAQSELDRFNASMGVPRPSHVYVGVVEPDGSVFINGPPSKLRQLFAMPGRLQSASRAPLPVYGGPCHAAHLYDHTDVAWIVRNVRPEIASRRCEGAASLLSMADGCPLDPATALGLLSSAVQILLTRVIRWAEVVQVVTRAPWWEEGHGPRDVQIMSCCTASPAVDGLRRALEAEHPASATVIHDLTGWLRDTPPKTGAHAEDGESKIAVVGMSCRLPGAEDIQQFWELLEAGRDVHQTVPANRYDATSHTDPTGRRANTSQTPFGCFIDNPGLFDATFFEMSPREAAQTDPTHRLALLTAYEALEQSGYVPNRTFSNEKVGTIYGHCSDDYREANAGQDIDMYFIPGNYRAFAPGRISYFFKLSGPSFSIDTACSASLAAVQIACATLSRREADMVVTGGLNILTSSDSFAGLSRAYFLSKTGGCKVFDNEADGYCRADGVASLVLKRLSDAQRDNDHILGVILGAATNHSSAAVSITHPHAPTQEDLFRTVLRQAGVSPSDVDLVEMHGTGTQAGDAVEMESVTKVFSSPSPPRRTEKLYISSVKANVGHGEAAAGVTALIKALLIFQHGAIPRHVGIKTRLNGRFPDLQRLNVHIPEETLPWPRQATRKRYIMVNNFSAAGGNTSLLLEEGPVRLQRDTCPHSRSVVAVSAKSAISLRRNLEQLIVYLERRCDSIQLASLAYTSTARRIAYDHRIAVHGTSVPEIISSLQERLQRLGEQSTPQTAKCRTPVAFVFSGQGSFYVGVGRDLLTHYTPYRTEIHSLDQICILHGFPSILPALDRHGDDDHHEDKDTAPPLEKTAAHTTSPLVAQLATTCVQIALVRLWARLGVTPHLVIGASLGEYAALYAAGALSASDAIYLVGQRALLMDELCTKDTHAMLAVQASTDQISQCVPDRSTYEISCVNGARSVTLAGLATDIAQVNAQLKAGGGGVRTTLLNVPYAFHSSQVDPILDRFDDIARTVPIRKPKVAVVSPLLADVVRAGQAFPPSFLRNATRSTVYFGDALAKACADGLVTAQTAWIEIGVHQTYSGAVRAATPGAGAQVIVPSLRSDEDNWSTFARGMAALHEAGMPLNWDEWYKPFEPELTLLVDLPRYQWSLKNYWIQYNGDWLLTKDKGSVLASAEQRTLPGSRAVPVCLRTALVQEVVEEEFAAGGGAGKIVVQSNIQGDDFFAVASGHRMCGRPVVSVFSYPEMALSVARYVYTQIRPNTPTPAMNFGKVKVLQGLIPRKDRSRPQNVRLRLEAGNSNPARYRGGDEMHVSLYTVDDSGAHLDDLATGVVFLEKNTQPWMDEWASVAHLVASRVGALHDLACDGRADRLTRDMVYRLFSSSIVDYSSPYRGIQSVVVHGLEAVADVVLAPSPEGKWKAAPPHHVDSIAHVGGFILNAGCTTDNTNTMYVMEGWKSMRFARALIPGTLYRSYVRMAPATDTEGFFVGDVYVLDGDEVVGQIGGMSLRPLPRILARRFFDPEDQQQHEINTGPSVLAKLQTSGTTGTTDQQSSSTTISSAGLPTPVETAEPRPEPLLVALEQPECEAADKALRLLSSETGVEMQDLTDELHLSEIGVDSLLSLVLVEKFALELDIHLPAHFFLESPSIGEIKARLRSQ